MRSHSNEHADSLPVLDISALKHVAYVLDALIYYMRSDTINTPIQSSSVNAFNDIDSESWVADQVSELFEHLNEGKFIISRIMSNPFFFFRFGTYTGRKRERRK